MVLSVKSKSKFARVAKKLMAKGYYSNGMFNNTITFMNDKWDIVVLVYTERG